MLIALLVLLPILFAPPVYALGRMDERGRDDAVVLLTGLELALSLCLFLSAGNTPGFYGLSEASETMLSDTAALAESPALRVASVLSGAGLSLTADGFRSVYSLITSLLWFVTSVFAVEYFRKEREGLNAYWMFLLLTLGATQGVMLSADFLTTFLFFEILSLTSFTWVIHEQSPEAVHAGYTYLFIAVGGGLVLFMGLALLYHACGTLDYAAIRALIAGGHLPDTPVFDGTHGLAASSRLLLPAGICILLGFGAKAGMFPLHVWLPLAHPVAPSPASALLSGLLTKVGIFGILMTSLEVLYDHAAFGLLALSLGLITMVLGAVLALFSVNLKRTLACSSMSQIGFILTGVGSMILGRAYGAAGEALLEHGVHAAEELVEIAEETVELAFSGAILHMVNHSILKLALFMAAGVVLMNLHALNLNDIQGWGRNKTALKTAFALGGLGISGVPLLNGYLSKTMLHEGIVCVTEAASVLGEAASEGLAAPSSGILSASGNLLLSLARALPGCLHAAEWVFLISGGCTFAYMLKLYFCVFVEKNADPKRQARFDRNPRCMNRVSTAAVLGSALLLIPMGQPWLMTRLAARMTGVSFHFAAFSLGNLKGGAVSLVIGGAVYLLIVRRALRPGGVYANLWPSALDLEGRGYRPLFTKWLPDLVGAAASLLAENRVLRPLCGHWLPEFAGAVTGTLAENRVLAPLCRGTVFLGAVVTRGCSDSLDALVLGLRRTVVREVRVNDGMDPVRPGRVGTFLRATHEALAPLLENFSFALLMTCVGISLILGVLVAAILL